MSAAFPWSVLAIAPTNDRKAIRSAYAERLKALDVDADVAGFEELRAAREEALYLASEGAEQARGGLLADDAPSPAASEADWDAPLTADELLPEPPFQHAQLAAQPTADPAMAAPAEPYDDRPDRLLALLYPGGEYDGAAMTPEEFAEAEALQRALIAEAQGAAIDRQHGIEMWLAHHLASTWPRSGPLVEEPGAAFGWDRAAGQLDENPAVAFLNNRLRAIAFVAELDQPTHPLHHEWNELRQPGARGPLPFRKAKTAKVEQLLATIRTNHPEVEEYLSPQRVQSWVGKGSGGGGSTWTWVLGVFFLLSIIGRCADATQDPQAGGPAPNFAVPEAPAAPASWSTEQRLGLINEVLGSASEAELALLDQDERALWAEMRKVTRYPHEESAAPQARLVEVIRGWTMLAAPDAPFAQLVRAKQVKLELMQLALAEAGADGCMMFSQSSLLPPSLSVPEPLREQERRLARDMLEGGRFHSVPVGGRSFQANIPGDMFAAAMAEAGLDEASAVAAATGQGSNAQQCAFRIALAQQVLRRPGGVSADLLKLL